MNFHAESGVCSSKNGWVMSIFVLFVLLYFVQTVHTNFHAKSGVCSSRNEWFMLNFAIWWPFCFSKVCQEMNELCSTLWFTDILFFGGHFVFWRPFCYKNSFRLSIRTSMQNLDSIAQEMSKLCSILRFGGHFVFQKKSKFVRTVHKNFHAKSQLCSSGNEWVMVNLVFGALAPAPAPPPPCSRPTYV